MSAPVYLIYDQKSIGYQAFDPQVGAEALLYLAAQLGTASRFIILVSTPDMQLKRFQRSLQGMYFGAGNGRLYLAQKISASEITHFYRISDLPLLSPPPLPLTLFTRL